MTDNNVHLIDFEACVKEFAERSKADDQCRPESRADLLLLTCIDFRFFLQISELMRGIKYDHVILAGAALGAVEETVPHWNQTFRDHLGLAIELHCVREVWVMEHRKCGAYGPPPGFDWLPENPPRDEEYQVHLDKVNELRRGVALPLRAFLLEVPRPGSPMEFEELK